eukprot:CAMPEP_0174834300 /NCGR_PEP_ID=MMETSP1114-20130205/4752_1 /TAXON_ID=312471 /ORGANISM="Neobodo designis, Strain CCAP 1951/1" /LENGTH=132 /DNA_ID=CAMNT_0016068207 /DNA_START=62 /DNA_END=457 /DNA_ORIENTATION=-
MAATSADAVLARPDDTPQSDERVRSSRCDGTVTRSRPGKAKSDGQSRGEALTRPAAAFSCGWYSVFGGAARVGAHVRARRSLEALAVAVRTSTAGAECEAARGLPSTWSFAAAQCASSRRWHRAGLRRGAGG